MAETLLIVFIVFILLGMPISIAMGVGALGAAMLYPALNPDHHPDPLRRPAVGLLSAAVGAAVHPGRQHRRARRRGARPHRPRHRAGRPLPRRPRLRQRGRQHVLRRHLGLGGGRRVRARHVPDPADGAQGLRPRLRHRAHRLHRRGGADHPAVDHRRHLRVDGRGIGGGHVRGRHHSGPPGGRRHGGAGVRHRQEAQLSQGAAADAAAVHDRAAQRPAGADDPGHHHGRHPVRHLHADRGRRRGGGLCAGRAADLLSRAGAARASRRSSPTRRGCRA